MGKYVKRDSIRRETRTMTEGWSDSRLLSAIIDELRRIEGGEPLTQPRAEIVRRARYARELSQLLSMRGEQLQLFETSGVKPARAFVRSAQTARSR